jgi:hypothetical protein
MRRGRLPAVVGLVLAVVAAGWLVYARYAPAHRQARAEAQLGLVLPSVELSDASLDQAIEKLMQASTADIVLDAVGLDGFAGGITFKLHNVTLDRALAVLTAYVSGNGGDVIYTIHDGRIVITRAEAAGRFAYARVYDVRDIETFPPEAAIFTEAPTFGGGGGAAGGGLFGPYSQDSSTPPEVGEEVARLVTETVSPDRWYDAGGNGANLQLLGGRLVIIATWEDHRQIRNLLSQLREPAKE